MKKLKIISLLVCLLTLFTACQDTEDEKFERTEKPEKSANPVSRTVLVYMVGDNGVSELSSLLKINLNDMKVGMNSVDDPDCNFIVYSEMVNDAPHLISLKKVKGKVVAETLHTYPEQNPLAKDVMSGIITETVERFPANSYGFVFLSHSSSWTPASTDANSRSIGYYRMTQMNIADFRDALSSSFPQPLKFILFDSCLMQSAEVAYELRNCTDYLIGSPAEIPGPGAPYQTVVPALFTDKDLPVNIANAYYDPYEERYGKGINTNDNWTAGVSISVIKSDALPLLATATKKLLSKYVQHQNVIDRSGLLLYDFSQDKANYDLDNLMQQLTGGKENADYKAWRQAFDEAVIYRKTTPQNYSGILWRSFSMTGFEGLSTYIPYGERNSTLNNFFRTLQWYSVAGWDKNGW